MAIDYLDPPLLAKRWYRSQKTLMRWRTAGSGPPFHKIGGGILYRISDIEAFENGKRKLHTTSPYIRGQR